MNAKTYHANGTKTKYGVRIAVQMPEKLFIWLKREAMKERRSLSSQILSVLDKELGDASDEVPNRNKQRGR